MAADPRLGPLTDLNFYKLGVIQIILMHTEAAGGHLYHSTVAVRRQVRVQTALTGIKQRAHILGSHGQRFLGIQADGAKAHGREHNGRLQHHLRRHFGHGLALALHLQPIRFTTQNGTDFHGLPQRVNRGVGHLGGIEQNFVPINGIRLRVAHSGQQHAAGICLAADLLLVAWGPVGIVSIVAHIFFDPKGTGGAQIHAPMAGHAILRMGHHGFAVRSKAVALVGALTHTAAAINTKFPIPHNGEPAGNIINHRLPPLPVPVG